MTRMIRVSRSRVVVGVFLLLVFVGCQQDEGETPPPQDFQEIQTTSVNCGDSLRVPIAQNSADLFVTVTTPESCTARLELFHRNGGDPLETETVDASSRFILQASDFYGEIGVDCLPAEEAVEGQCEVRVAKKTSPAGQGAFHKVAGGIGIPCRTAKPIFKAFSSRTTIVKVKFVSTCGGNNDTAEVFITPRVQGADPQGNPIDLTPRFVESAPGEFLGIFPVHTMSRGFISGRCNGDGNNPCEAEISIN